MHPDTARLFALDAALHAEADAMLLASGLGAIIAESGYVPVGSYVMRTMTWHDLDFELHVEEPDWERHLEIGMRLARTGWPRRLVCEDGFRRDELTSSYYWGLRVSDPALGCLSDADERIWKLDLHMSTPEQFAHAHRPPRALAKLMTDEARAEILALKEAFCHTPEYRRAVLSIHLYEAVLEAGVRGMDEFRQWHAARMAAAS